MHKASENDGSMVGMDQCRISSTESTSSSLLEGSVSTSLARGPLLIARKGRGSQSSVASSEGIHEDVIPTGGITEADPLLGASVPVEFIKGRRRVKRQAELVDESEDYDTVGLQGMKENLPEIVEKVEGTELNCENYANSHPLEFNFNIVTELSTKLGNASNDTVCTSSSSTTAATTAVASSKSSKSANAPGNNSRPGKSSNNKNKRFRHSSTETDEASEISATLEPPDGGWGWVVVAASFLVNLIADGVTFSFGVFFTEFTIYFKESESTTAWIGSLLAAMPLLSGPIASWLTDRYGCKNVTIVGGLLAAFGFVLSSYTTSIYVLMITFGVITGFGLSLCYVAAVVIVAYYFERRRSFATGLSVCGGGIGTFLFAPISQRLIEWYGWQMTTLFLAGAFLLLCGCGFLMKDLEWTKKKNKSSNNNNSNSTHNVVHHGCNDGFPCSNHPQYGEKTRKHPNRRCNSAICIPTFVQEQERRERRQRYYSCNQDADGADGVAVKQDLIVIDSSSPGGGNKSRSVKTKLLSPHTDYADSEDIGLKLSPAITASYGDEAYNPSTGSTSNLENGSGGSTHYTSPINSIPMVEVEDVQQRLLPNSSSGDLKIIPEEKDTILANGNLAGLTGETRKADDTQRVSICSPSSTELNTPSGPLSYSSNDSNFVRTNFNNNNINAKSGEAVDPQKGTAIQADAAPPDLINHIHQHANFLNNDSNNSSINNVNFINTSITSNGVVRNNSICNNSVGSFNTGTIMPNNEVMSEAINGFPTLIIPPAQQSKQSSNARLDIVNSARYRSVMHRHSLTYRGAVLNLKRYRLRPANSCPDIISVATSVDGRGSFDVCRWMRNICEWDNLMNTPFLLFILSNLLLYTWYDVPYMYLQTAAVRHGYSEDLSSYLISSIGLSNVVGNIMLGYMGDKEWASATLVYGVCMIICGGSTVFMPYLMETSFWALFIFCGIFGLTIAANYALTSVILVQVVSLERFASAYGLLLLVQGIGNLVGPPIAGVISDFTGNNSLAFVVAGVGIFLSSFFVLAPVFQRKLVSDAAENGHVTAANHNKV